MKQIIFIRDQDGAVRPGVEADVVKGIAVHPDVFLGYGYSVTHVQSGARFKKVATKADAIAFRSRLLKIQIGGVGLGYMPGCELCANALLITEQLQLTLDVEATNHAAEILCNTK